MVRDAHPAASDSRECDRGGGISFSDVSENVRARETLAQANDLLRLAAVARDAHDAVIVQDLEGRHLARNPGAVRLYGWSEAEALNLKLSGRVPKGTEKEALTRILQLSQTPALEPIRAQRLSKRGGIIEVSLICAPLLDQAGKIYAVASTEREMKSGDGTRK
jgi:two-component system, chemotaxis family, CheB/CheR fusion protein